MMDQHGHDDCDGAVSAAVSDPMMRMIGMRMHHSVHDDDYDDHFFALYPHHDDDDDDDATDSLTVFSCCNPGDGGDDHQCHEEDHLQT